MRIVFLLALVNLLSPANALGQSITRVEYFFDSDPGYGNGTPLAFTPAPALDLNENVSLVGLSPGAHVLYVRARDANQRWSLVQKKLFQVYESTAVEREITQVEYYFDSDPGYGNGVQISFTPGDTLDLNAGVSLAGLSPGVHVLYVRAKDSLEKWSLTQKKQLLVQDGPLGAREITQLEYYLDEDPGYGNGTPIPITAAPNIDVNALVPTAGLNGNHFIYVRAKDNWGRWSYVLSDTLVWSTDTVRLISPNGGQAYTAGGAMTNLSFYKSPSVGPVTLQLVRPNGTVVHTIATNVTASPYPSWTIPYTLNAGQYKIKVFEDSEPTVADFSDNTFSIGNAAGYCAAFTDLSAPGERLDAASCLCSLGYIAPQSYNAYNNTYGVNPGSAILRADLAKLVYYAIYQGNAPSPAESFPVPFTDLQQSGDPYFKYAKALSYLEYEDDVTPFDRDFINFRPYEPIEARYALKILLEAFDIAPDNSNGGPLLGLSPGEDAYGYVHRAYSNGWIPATMTQATGLMGRGDMFVVVRCG